MADSGETSNGVKVADRASERASFMAGTWGSDESEKKPAAGEAGESTESDIDENDGDDLELDADGVDLDDEVDLDDDSDQDEEGDDSTDEGEKPDADTSKRMDAVRRREQRSREQLASERKAFESERDAFVAEWKPKIEAAEKFEALKSRGVNAFTALDVLRELGLSDDDLLQTSRNIYAASSEGTKDPKNAEAIARLKKERERDERLAKLEREDAERKAAEKKAAEDAQAARAATQYLDRVAKAAPAGTLAAHYLKANPERTRGQLGKIAMQLAERDGGIPTEKQVLAAYEKARAKQLKADGIDPATITKAAPAKEQPVKNGEKKPAKPTTETEEPLTKAAFLAARKSVS